MSKEIDRLKDQVEELINASLPPSPLPAPSPLDSELAKGVRQAVKFLNEAMLRAAGAGLEVEVAVEDPTWLRGGAVTHVQVKVSRPV